VPSLHAWVWLRLAEEVLRRLRDEGPDRCWICGGPPGFARVWTRAGEPALWVPACVEHRTPLILMG
jgi:hypothetical protein